MSDEEIKAIIEVELNDQTDANEIGKLLVGFGRLDNLLNILTNRNYEIYSKYSRGFYYLDFYKKFHKKDRVIISKIRFGSPIHIEINGDISKLANYLAIISFLCNLLGINLKESIDAIVDFYCPKNIEENIKWIFKSVINTIYTPNVKIRKPKIKNDMLQKEVDRIIRKIESFHVNTRKDK